MQTPGFGTAAASYNSRQFIIAAGESSFIDTDCQLVAVLTLDGADTFAIRLNAGQVGQAFESWQFRAPTADGVRKVELINDNGAEITLVVAFATGELVDGRFALPGALEVDINEQTLSPLVTSHDLSDSPGGNANTSPIGSAFYNRTNQTMGVVTLVTPAANTAGLIVRHCSLAADPDNVALLAHTSAPSAYSDTAAHRLFHSKGGTPRHLPFPLAVPAGMGLYVAANDAFDASIGWDVL